MREKAVLGTIVNIVYLFVGAVVFEIWKNLFFGEEGKNSFIVRNITSTGHNMANYILAIFFFIFSAFVIIINVKIFFNVKDKLFYIVLNMFVMYTVFSVALVALSGG